MPDPAKSNTTQQQPLVEDLEAQRQELFVELLQYMEAPNGNVEELMEKTKLATNTCRSFIYTLVRKRWVSGHRILTDANEKSVTPITVWPGREWMAAIELPNITENDAKNLEPTTIGQVALYRFDSNLRKHMLDHIILVKTSHFPKEVALFNELEPAKDNTLESRKKWEDWHNAKLAYEQGDFPQFMLTFQKLKQTNNVLIYTFNNLELTLVEMKNMGTLLHDIFDGISVPELRKIVVGIPSRIKDVAKNLQKTTGIIIQDAGLKLTPAFLQQMSLNGDLVLQMVPRNDSQTGPIKDLLKPKSVHLQISSSASDESNPTIIASRNVSPDVPATTEHSASPASAESLTMGGVPVNLLIPMLKKQINAEEKASRRKTYLI
ncbi:hypothetical protein HK100_006602 [Physocladia obscura]|uniref:Uncharacterized protein n=1 Tax=Physocladia obscura TaxID=109957 RepID=A0AAD5XCJ8_9FUNG|nr:hypothetical protein HK100_006602 [Physocladia obscura]